MSKDKQLGNKDASTAPKLVKEAPPEVGQVEDKGQGESNDQVDTIRSSKISFSGGMTREEATAYFEAIAAGLRRGSLLFRRGNEPAPHVEVEVKASSKERKGKVSFEISWTTDSHSDLEIS